MAELSDQEKEVLKQERLGALAEIEDWLDIPMLVLGFAWLVLLIVEFVWGLSPLLQATVTAIWIIFIADFLLRLLLAPDKLHYLRKNWLTTIALFLPALRVYRFVRIFRLARLARGARLVRIVTALNRGMRGMRRSMARYGFGYVVALTILVTLVGAAGVYAIEGGAPGSAVNSYGEAVWWTAMLMTTIGPPTAPQTGEGRILYLLLALYAFAIFGYVTATLASYLIGREAAEPTVDAAPDPGIAALHDEIRELRAEVRGLREQQRQG